MGKNKEYNPKELDTIQEAYNKSDEMEKKEAKYRKQENIKKRNNEKEERLDIERDIIKKYGSDKVKEEHLIKKGMTDIHPKCCMVCFEYKVFPYDFLTAKGSDNDKSNCSTCMGKITKRVMKYKVKCVCGALYLNTDLGHSKHECGKMHINAIKQMKVTGLSVVYKRPSLLKICDANAIKYYANGSIDDILKKIKALDKIIIPEGLDEDIQQNVE